MKELNYRFKSIEEKIINGKEVHKASDIFENRELFIEKYKEIKDNDWDATRDVEKELDKLKDNKLILDFFYNNDYSNDIKTFYKVLQSYEGFDSVQTVKETVQKPVKETVQETVLETVQEAVRVQDIEPIQKPIQKPVKEPVKEPVRVQDIEPIQPVQEPKVYNINELGGSVKIIVDTKPIQETVRVQDIEPIQTVQKEEDIFVDPIFKELQNNKNNFTSGISIKTEEHVIEVEKTDSLELNFKKTRSRTSLNEKIICKLCEQPINKERLDLENNIAYCDNCHAIREIRKLGKEEEVKTNIGIITPEGITVKNTNSKLQIETELNVKIGILMFFSSIVMFIMSFFFREANGLQFFYFMILASMVLGYMGLVKLLNRINVDVTKQNIDISSKPLPHFPSKKFQSDRITQIYVKEYMHRNKNNVSFTYKLRAILKNGKDIVLVTLDNPEYAVYLERSIESWLGIEDRKVTGEYK